MGFKFDVALFWIKYGNYVTAALILENIAVFCMIISCVVYYRKYRKLDKKINELGVLDHGRE